MSMFKRVVSMLLAVVLLVTGVDLSFLRAASAEGSAGGMEVGEAPEKVLEMGEWRYWVEDGQAIIAGYANPAEASLTVPSRLGGYPVTGIAHRAFASNTGLMRIQLHTNVTAVADDAFAGLENVTIAAYHGAYALDYAKERGMTGENMSSVAEFADGALDLTGLSLNAYTGLRDDRVTFHAKEATFLRVGQVVYFPVQNGYPTGLASKITSLTQEGDLIHATMARPDEGTIFKRLHVQEEVTLDWKNAVCHEGVTMDDTSAEAIKFSVAPSFSFNFPVGDKKVSGSISVAESLKVDVDLGWDGIVPKIVKASVEESTTTTLKGTVSDGFDIYKKRVGKRHKEKLKAIEVPILNTGTITGYVAIDLVVSVSGEVSVEYTVNQVQKWEYKNNKLSNTRSKSSSWGGAVSASVKFGPEMSMYLVIGFAKLSVRFFEVSGGVFLEGTGEMKVTSVNGTASSHVCVEFAVKAYLEFNVKFGIIKVFSKDMGLALSMKGTVELVPEKKKHFDYPADASAGEIIFTTLLARMLPVDQCYLENRKASFDPGNGSKATELEFNVNEVIREPDKPVRKGYKFEGWYVDTEKSGLPGEDYKLVANVTKMPYVDRTGTLYLKAQWRDVCPVTSITLNKTSITGLSNVSAKDKLTVKALKPSNANNKEVKWSSSNKNVATVDQKGNVKLKNAGTATITCRSVGNPDAKATCQVTVLQSVTGITLNKNSIFRYSDNMSSVQLSAGVQPSNAANKAVEWTSSNPAVAAVSSTGLVTLKGLGTATITCSSVSNPNVKATCTVTVRQAVTGITLDRKSQLRTNADMSALQLKATVSPTNAFNKELKWESTNPAVATVSASGKVTMKGVGTTTIVCRSASNPGVTASFELTIIQAVTEITLNENAVTRYSDCQETIVLTANVHPASAGNKAVTWESSDPAVVTVSGSGVVTVVGAGSAVVTCRSVSNPNVTANCRFTILQAVTGITLNRTEISTTSDEINVTYLLANVAPADAADKAVSWKSTNVKVAEVTGDGVVTIKGAGDAKIICTSVSAPYIAAVCAVSVEQAVTDITLSENSIFRYSSEKDSVQLVATLTAADVADREVKWSSSEPGVATVSDSGIVSIVGAGEAIITCRSVSNPDVMAECLVTVKQSVTGIALNETDVEYSSDSGASLLLTAALSPADAANPGVLWESSDDAVATVTDTGMVTIVGPGTAVITCCSISDPSVSTSCTVNVRQAVENLFLSAEEIIRYTNETGVIKLAAYVQPSYAYNSSVEWTSSNDAVAVVSDEGVVEIKGVGEAVITCVSRANPAVSARCSIIVRQAVSSVTLDRTEMKLRSDAADIQLSADVQPSGAENLDVIWTSSDPAVVTVTENGLVSVTGCGTATITCYAVSNPDAFASCMVTVEQAVQAIVVNETDMTCYADETEELQLTAVVQPAHAADKSLLWTSSNEEAVTVSDTGMLTIVGVGEATITCLSASNPAASAVCTVTVLQPMTGIALDRTAVTLFSDDTAGVQLGSTIIPAETEDTQVIWESSNTNVAVVSDTGLVNAVAQGSAIIVCRSARNPETIYATCAVTVCQRVEEMQVEGDTASLLPGETLQLTAVCYPEYADDTSVIWSTSDETVATVDEDGRVTAVSYGSAVITAAAGDGRGAAANYPVNVEHELVLQTVVETESVYAQGNENVILGSVSLGSASVRRLAEMGLEPVWTLEKTDETDDVQLSLVPTAVTDRGQRYDSSYVLLRGSSFHSGSQTYTVKCQAGSFTETVQIVLLVDGTAYADKVSVSPSTMTQTIGQSTLLPMQPVSADGNPLPADTMLVDITGDAFFTGHASVDATEDGYAVSFDESGVYSATLTYRAGNIAYETNVSFFVQDENGIVHIRTESINLDESFVTLVQGEGCRLTAQVKPLDAFDPGVTWSSTDESVVTVDQTGAVRAVAPGKAAIVCTANDGNGATAMCAVNVESFLQLDDAEMNCTVYTGGSSNAELGTVNVTIESEKRLCDAGLNVTWTLEKLRGAASEIAVSEFRSMAEQGITVSGNRIRLLRMNAAGTDEYRLTCRAGDYTDSCIIRISVEEQALPGAIALTRTEYTGMVNEAIVIDTACTGGELPAGTQMTIRGGNAFENAISSEYTSAEPEKLFFDVPGTYAASVIFSGSNYSYACPVTIVVQDEDGSVPRNITGMYIDQEHLYMMAGEQAQLTAGVEPADAPHGSMAWASSDTAVVTVSASGLVTAIGAGKAYVTVSVPESDYEGGCYVIVEDGLTLQSDSVERTVFVDGITRTQLEIVQLTTAASRRQEAAPEWRLTRVSGNNLTLKAKEYNTIDADGEMVYGCEIILYSMSREGTAEYELSCTAGGETVVIPVTVHAIRREMNLPAALSLGRTEFTAGVNELITIVPEFVCLPEGTKLPDGLRAELTGDALFTGAQNTADFCVSQNMTTLSFNRAGLFEANFIYSYSNMRYVVPVTFRIADESGKVPVLSASMTLSSRSMWLVEGESGTLNAVFTPANADERGVTWRSSDETVATVDANGVVRAVGKGEAIIICTPDDPYLSRQTCTVRVEDYLAFETAPDYMALYRQGEQKNEVFSVLLSEGTMQRLKKAGVTPEWKVTRISGDSSVVVATASAAGDSLIVTSSLLASCGTDVYCVTCQAGEYTRSCEFTLEVLDLGDIAEFITLAQSSVAADVGETVTIDFTPVCIPAGSSLPDSEDMWGFYSGVGEEFYAAMDHDVYAEEGDRVTVRFTRPGRYLLSRQFFLDNLHYEQVCEINVGQSEAAYHLLTADTTDAIIYMGGTAGTIAEISLTDSLMHDLYGDEIQWSLKRVSGSSLRAVLRDAPNGVSLYMAYAAAEGEDVWRVTCTFGEFSESIDVRVSVRKPRSEVPDTLTLSVNQISGMMGDWLSLPIAAECSPSGTALPETGDDFWRFDPVGMAADVCVWEIEDGVLRVRFLWPGSYTGMLCYEAGSFRYAMPVYMTIMDEEGVLPVPAMEMYLLDTAETVYAAGKTGTVIGTAQLSRGLSPYYAGETEAYLVAHGAEWNICVTSGTAAQLSLREDGSGAAIVLDAVNGAGIVTYDVSCTVNGVTYAATETLEVLDAAASKPVPVLDGSIFYGKPGEMLIIPTSLYESGSDTILQGETSWSPDAFLPAIGYEYTETVDQLRVTFYEEGTYHTSITASVGNLVYKLPFTIVISSDPDVQLQVMKLPAMLEAIEAEAFLGSRAQIVDLRGTRVTKIGSGAFRDCADLIIIYIPAAVTDIATDAFAGCTNVTIVCGQRTYADEYASAQGIAVRHE